MLAATMALSGVAQAKKPVGLSAPSNNDEVGDSRDTFYGEEGKDYVTNDLGGLFEQ